MSVSRTFRKAQADSQKQVWQSWPAGWVNGCVCFHCIQMGRYIQTGCLAGLTYVDRIVLCEGFHSLQTGKGIARRFAQINNDQRFMRFPFPSNGKGHCKLASIYAGYGQIIVSIPFRPESALQEFWKAWRTKKDQMKFPSPSNGKAYPKVTTRPATVVVLIKSFHPLQTGKPIQSMEMQRMAKIPKTLSFNSLQTGKPIQSCFAWDFHPMFDEFQFPSNGKAYPKRVGW